MNGKVRLIVLGLLAAAVLFVLLGPGSGGLTGRGKFAATAEPQAALAAAQAEGKPVFLEFYGKG